MDKKDVIIREVTALIDVYNSASMAIYNLYISTGSFG